MRRLSLAVLLLPLALSAGEFKRLYPGLPGMRVSELKALPGGAVAIRFKPLNGGEERNVMLLVSQSRGFLSGGEVEPVAGGPSGDLVWRTEGARLVRTLKNPRLLRLPGGDEPAARPPAPGPEASRFLYDGVRFFWLHPGGKKQLFETLPGSTLVEWGQTREFGWVVTSTKRGVPFAPPRRECRIYAVADGAFLGSTVISKEAPEKQLAVAFLPDGPDQPGALAVVTGAALEWWSPNASDLERWGEVTIDPAKAESAAAPEAAPK